MQWAATANPTTTNRTATINLTPVGGTPRAFTVTQEALGGTLIPGLPSLTFSYQQLGPIPADTQIIIGSAPLGLAVRG
jgi:hypothetical protein